MIFYNIIFEISGCSLFFVRIMKSEMLCKSQENGKFSVTKESIKWSFNLIGFFSSKIN